MKYGFTFHFYKVVKREFKEISDFYNDSLEYKLLITTWMKYTSTYFLNQIVCIIRGKIIFPNSCYQMMRVSTKLAQSFWEY